MDVSPLLSPNNDVPENNIRARTVFPGAGELFLSSIALGYRPTNCCD